MMRRLLAALLAFAMALVGSAVRPAAVAAPAPITSTIHAYNATAQTSPPTVERGAASGSAQPSHAVHLGGATGGPSPVSAVFVAADTADGAATAGRDAAQSCLNSFTADTPVTLADGTQEPISKVKVGDMVLATDPETGQTKAEPVEQLIRHRGEHQMVLVGLADGSVLDSTDGHPIWDPTTGRFTAAADLHVDDKIETSNGQLITITALTKYAADLTAYNLQITTIHTYYAGATPVLVHNSCDPSVTFGHGARHLAGTGLSDTEVESAIQSHVEQSVANASSTGSFYGRVTVRGTQVEYRAYTLPNGTINVGTYYVP